MPLNKIITEGFCIGCGSCAFVRPDALTMRMADDGHWHAEQTAPLHDGEEADLLQICPMSGMAPDEDLIAKDLFPDLTADPLIGRIRRNLVGHVAENGFRDTGGSGGMVSWLLTDLLRRREIDAVIHVRPTEGTDPEGLLFRYAISENEDQIRQGAKSRYYPIEMSQVLQMILNDDRRFAIVGLPCFIKAVRLLQRDRAIPEGRIRYCIGLVCGHLKSRYFADYLAWQKQVDPDCLVNFDFRRKLPDRPASAYGFAAKWRDPSQGSIREVVHPMSAVNGGDWGEGIMKNTACEFCDDVMAECADVVIGDAWLPGHVNDWRGTNVVTVREPRLDRFIAEGEANGQLAFAGLSSQDVARSQAAGLRHRRDGLAHRLARMDAAGLWRPQKRVKPALAPNAIRQEVYDLRLRIAQETSAAFSRARAGSGLESFQADVAPLLERYRRAVRGPIQKRILGKGRRIAGRLWRMSFGRLARAMR